MREFIDAECLVPAAVTESAPDIELRPLRNNEGQRQTNAGVDLASMDSTDTFASCNTHPFNSQADLTDDIGVKDSNLYVNPLDADDSRISSSAASAGVTAASIVLSSKSPTPKSSPRHRPKPYAYTTESFDDTKSTDNLLGGSRTSLQDSPLPKHRRARFQEVIFFLLPIYYHYHYLVVNVYYIIT